MTAGSGAAAGRLAAATQAAGSVNSSWDTAPGESAARAADPDPRPAGPGPGAPPAPRDFSESDHDAMLR